ncbi:hypothetical protein G7Z17_g758 [Cylindrodendrum hubeiense]|uniref:CFEM domain-containing protein n=1 Tax=Cylindrodendrum hubeiense TaxID=595255 RepID=A0A9P5HJJ6_9HYPO|nr:hypothetical protein G7Z17_g758 [Cylindrodendrum hubeiense]
MPDLARVCRGLSGTGSSSECESYDLNCICKNKAYLSAGVCCLHESCTDSAREEAEDYARSVCSYAGYSMPTGIACSTVAATDTQASETASATADDSNTTADSTADSSVSQTAANSDFAVPTSDDSSDSSSGYTTKKKSSKTLKTGLGVGLGVGIPLISAALGYLALLRRKKNRQAMANNQPPPMPNNQQPPMSAYQAPPPQGYPPSGYPPQNQGPPGYPPQGWHPHGYVVPQQTSDAQSPSPPTQSSTPLKYEPSVSPEGTAITNQHEMMGTTPSPRQELHSDTLSNPPLPNELHSNPQLPPELHSTPRPVNPVTELP